MKKNVFLLTAATLAGVAAGSISTLSLTAKAAIEKTEDHTICGVLPLAAQGQLEAFAVNRGCSEIDALYDLEGEDTCGADNLGGASIVWKDVNDDGIMDARMCVRFVIPGHFVAGPPE
jgi:hypothetical protein